MPRKIPRLLWLAVPLAYLLYFYHLSAVGMIPPDEPRYASIGREMARSGDWITPRLWGEVWFEKPALLYWMIGGAFRMGLGPDLAPRLPIALTAVAFLAFFWWFVRREFGSRNTTQPTACNNRHELTNSRRSREIRSVVSQSHPYSETHQNTTQK